MSQERTLYSDSWHRVQGHRINLRPSVQIKKQAFRGRSWYVLYDRFNNRFFRFRPEAYAFIARLSSERTVDETWQKCLEEDPDNAPGQEEVIRMLAQLYQASLLQSDVSPDAVRLFDRFRKQKQRELRAKLMSILFVRIPLFDPNRLLDKTMPFAKLIFSRFGFVIWLAVVAVGLNTAFSNFGELVDQSEGVLNPANIGWLYGVFLLVKFLHEGGHAYITKKYGGEVHTCGIMLMVFNPIPFVDATAAWAFRERWKRVLVGSGGMMVELFLASIAALVWVNTGDGILHAVAYNVMFVASVSTLLLNINPLMRFDGYYILSDLTDTPNLHQRAARQFFYVCERFLYGNKDGKSIAESTKESFWLCVFAVAGWIYRLFIFSAILWFVADRFFGLGFIAAMIGLVTFIIVPIIKHIRYLFAETRIEHFRPRAMAVSSVAWIALIGFFGFVPMPNSFYSSGVVATAEHADVYASVEGNLRGGILESHNPVERGSSIFQTDNPELDILLRRAEAQLSQVKTLEQMSMTNPDIMIPVRKRKEAIEGQISKLKSDIASLQYKAQVAGLWVAPQTGHLHNAWVNRGSKVGLIINPGDYTFNAVVKQRHARHLFNDDVKGASIRIPGQAEHKLPLSDLQFIQGEQHLLPHAGLGWGGGGDIEVQSDDTGLRAVEPFFLVKGKIVTAPEMDEVSLMHDQIARVRFDLPATPYFVQWFTLLRQLLQERFEI